ncbi:MAG: tRNA (adenosine(37)-N6)-dimethylallyltransferase MiaA [Actinomycetia bacterium]|nr:tRNA (adenosine(37)-N6)-dimethylallyltransferase MiaA [Actinomycetes bacterium]
MSEPAGPTGQPALIAVVGATALGKSDLAVELALAGAASGSGAEVVNADSMQVYSGMDIGTAKLTEPERRGVPHHVLDVWPVTKTATLAEYQRLALAAIEEIRARGNLPIMVGGSGMYVHAVVDKWDIPGTDPEVRSGLDAELVRVGPEVLHQRLAELDPAAGIAILPTNGRRIVRALEVVAMRGSFSAQLPSFAPNPDVRLIGLRAPRPVLDERIQQRVDRMWQQGLEDEVRGLERAGLREGRTASRALGYAQVLSALAGECSEDEAREETVRATRRFARRQESWFGRDPRIEWQDA